MAPRVSVVVTCCDYGRFLDEAVRSVLDQSFRDLEVIVVDDGSKDDTPEVCRSLAAGDPRVRVVRQPNSGQPAIARNRGVAAASGELLLCLDADDRIGAGFLDACVAALDADTSVSIAYPDQLDFGDRDAFVPHPEYDASHLPLFNFIPPASVFRRAAFDDVGGFRVNVVGYEDWDFWVACLATGHRGVHVPGAVWHYRRHGGGLYDSAVPNDRKLKSRVVLNNPTLYSDDQVAWARAVDRGDPRIGGLEDRLGVVPVFAAREPSRQVSSDEQRPHVLFFMYGWSEEGGGTILPRQIARELARRGHRVSVIHAAAHEAPGRPAFHVERSMDDGVELWAIYNRKALFVDPSRPLLEADDPEARAAVGALLDRLRPDVAHVHSFLGFSMGLLDELDARGIPALYTSHNYWPVCPRMYLFENELESCSGPEAEGRNCAACIGEAALAPAFARRLLNGQRTMSAALHRHLAVSTNVRDRFVAAGFDGDNIEVLQQQPQTVDSIWERVGRTRAPVERLERPLRVGFIGSVAAQKGVHVLAKAVQHLAHDVEVHVFGGGHPDYVSLVRRIDVNGVLRFRGRYETDELAELLAGVDVVAVPSIWEDCAPLVVAEAMAAKCPVLGSRIGGIPDFIRDGVDGMLVNPRDPAALGSALAAFIADPALLGRLQRAIAPPRGFAAHVDDLEARYAGAISSRPAAQRDDAAVGPGTARIVWEGSQFVNHSLAIVNREITRRLIDDGNEVSLALYEEHQFEAGDDPELRTLARRFGAPLSGPAEVWVRHMWPPRLERPPSGRWVVIQPWEFGSIPKAWVEPFRRDVDEIWVPSSYVRDCYVEGGVPAEKIVVIPNGVDTERFTPNGSTRTLRTRKSTKLLFVGGTIARKGIEVLLDAYRRAFTAADDVCLVIKDTCGETVYRGRNARAQILELVEQPGAPEVEYIERDLDVEELAALYRTCDVLVHPYLGEGFGMPILEAMASGLPVVVTGMGAALDFCDEQNAWLIPARRIETASRRIGELECVANPWVAMPDIEALVEILRALPGDVAGRRARGVAGRRRAVEHYTWNRVVARVEERIDALRRDVGEKEKNEMTHEDEDLTRVRALLAPALAAVQAGNLEEARIEFEHVTKNRPDLAAGHAGLGTVQQRLGEHPEAAASMRIAVTLAPDDAQLVNQLGVAAYRSGGIEEARRSFERACELDASFHEARLNLGRLEQSEGRPDLAANHVVAVLSAAPADPTALELYARVCRDVEFASGFEKAVAALAAVDPSHPALDDLQASLPTV